MKLVPRPVTTILLELQVRDLADELAAIAKRWDCTLEEVLGQRRLKGVAAARHECFALLRQRGWSFPRIGELLGRHHATVMHGVRKHYERVIKGAA